MILYFLHGIVTWLLTGLIWTIQWVHYPFFKFANLNPNAFIYHQQRISVLVVPLMLFELITGLILLIRDGQIFPIINLINISLIILIWLHTFLIMVRIHRALDHAPSLTLIQQLVHQNWVRTMAWSLKAILWGGAIWHLISI
ncbi:MAG: hypothetical protein VW397_03330 [Candidatus Margulisiibacteriota bacterium]